MKKVSFDRVLQQFNNAHRRLREVLLQPTNEFMRDSAIQRFEFTFELFWKILRLYALYDGIEVNSPRSSIREGFRLHLFEDEELFLAMLESRNMASHTYEEEIAEEIYQQLPQYAKAMENTILRIQSILKN
jgi:nucleotidyltransferase substrate binding protein (TIGR01987 family)